MATSDNEKPFDLSENNTGCRDGLGDFAFYQYQGFWFYAKGIENVKDFQQNFKALDTDIVIATLPKAGTTWLKALAFAIVNRSRYPSSSTTDHHHPLLTVSPHDHHERDSPSRLIATHVPYPSLPESIKSCINCKVVYLCRNPKDNFISLWHFINKLRALQKDISHSAPMSIEEGLEFFCSGNRKLKPKDYGFSTGEESRGVIDEILHLCSFQHLKDLDVNKNGTSRGKFKNIEFYMKGEVGDWKNHLTPLMVS
ncbi:hypothetical protein MKX03_028328 [Papaver bracteatum]|nr:hypothetical protein MKX03_028328 [Papaver bracteatum]